MTHTITLTQQQVQLLLAAKLDQNGTRIWDSVYNSLVYGNPSDSEKDALNKEMAAILDITAQLRKAFEKRTY